ncbi:hypothetical protein PMAYCL1PPCAC_25430, partial [Pristionchus mayeri]
MLYAFGWEQASLRSLQHELRLPDGSTISKQSHTDYMSFFREICAVNNKRQPPIGGPGCVVEIDETAFSKRKYNRGKRMAAQQWVFGGVMRGDKTKLFAVPVAKRDIDTLIPLIARHIARGTEIHSDCWPAYNRIETLGLKYRHLKVNHSITFKCKITGACTNTVEGMWQKLKLGHKKRFGTHRSQLTSHIDSAVFFVRYELEDRFEALLKAI